ncbi:hypothetical protein STFR1_20263 [Bacillus vallismortis]
MLNTLQNSLYTTSILLGQLLSMKELTGDLNIFLSFFKVCLSRISIRVMND